MTFLGWFRRTSPGIPPAWRGSLFTSHGGGEFAQQTRARDQRTTDHTAEWNDGDPVVIVFEDVRPVTGNGHEVTLRSMALASSSNPTGRHFFRVGDTLTLVMPPKPEGAT